MSYLANIQDSYGNVLLKHPTSLLQFGGSDNTAPAILAVGTSLHVVLADGSSDLTDLVANNAQFADVNATNVTVTGTLTANGFTPEGSIVIGDAYYFGFTGQTKIKNVGDGNLLLTNNAGTSFNAIQFGNNTASAPALAINGANLAVILADGSGPSSLSALNLTAVGNINLGTSMVLTGTTTPATDATHGQLYAKSDGYLYYLDTNGVEYEMIPEQVNGITALTGDVSAMGPGSAAATVNSVGGASAADIANATLLANSSTPLDIANAIVSRDGSGNFAAGVITAALNGNASTSTSFTGSLVGDVTGTQGATVVSMIDGYTAAQIGSAYVATSAATDANTPSTLVERDASGNFSAGTITANLTGLASSATTSVSFSGNLTGDVQGTQSATVVSMVGGATAANVANAATAVDNATDAAIANTLILRDGSASFSANTATLNGLNVNGVSNLNSDLNVTGNTVLAGTYVGGNLQATTATIFGISTQANTQSANYTLGASDMAVFADATAGAFTVTIPDAGVYSGRLVAVKKIDSSANAITINSVAGNIDDQTSIVLAQQYQSAILESDSQGNWHILAESGLGGAETLTGDVTGTISGTNIVTTVAMVDGYAAIDVGSATALANAATDANTPSTLVRRDASGNFTAGTITANLTGLASSATTSVSFTGPLAGDVTGTQGATVVSLVGGATAADVASTVAEVASATNANVPGTLVIRDGSGNFAAGDVTGSSFTSEAINVKDSVSNNNISLTSSTGTSGYTVNLPSVGGSSGQFLTTDGSNNWSWTTASGTIGGSGAAKDIAVFSGTSSINGDGYLTFDNTIGSMVLSTPGSSTSANATTPLAKFITKLPDSSNNIQLQEIQVQYLHTTGGHGLVDGLMTYSTQNSGSNQSEAIQTNLFMQRGALGTGGTGNIGGYVGFTAAGGNAGAANGLVLGYSATQLTGATSFTPAIYIDGSNHVNVKTNATFATTTTFTTTANFNGGLNSSAVINTTDFIASGQVNAAVLVSGSVALQTTTQNADYVVDSAQPDYTIFADGTSNAVTLTLVDASAQAGRILNIKKIDSTLNVITINSVDGIQTIDGQTSQQLTTQFESMTLQSDGSNWFIL